MSLFYNRDRNITGVEQITSMFAINPNYGSTVSFVCKNNRVDYNNNTFSIMPSTLNNVTANCSFNFTTNEEQAKKIVNFFESQSGTGYFGIADSSLIYQTLYGFANGFDISMDNNNLYNISLNFSVERNASALDWSGMSFVNYLFEEWQTGKAYSKYQPVYFETQKDNLIKNFFYAKESHTSSLDKAPTSEEYWTQEFFFEDDLGLKVSTEPTIDFLNFKNSFPQRIKSQDNIHTFRKLDLGFKNLSDFKLKSMLHFLESHLGYLKFQFNCPKIYDRPKIFYAESWTHTWNYKDSHNLTVTLAEDPLGILNQIDSPDVSLFQDTTDSSISLDAFSEDGIFIIDFSGKKQTVENGLFSENWAGQGRTLKLYQQLNSVSCTEQDLRKISFGNRVELKTGDFSQNSISEVNFNSAKKIEYLNLSGNLINNFSCLNVTGLKYINLNDNNLTGANFSGCNNLTGVFIQKTGNVISQSSLGTILNGVGNGDGISGTIRCSGIVSGSSSLLSKVSNLDYRKWTQEYSGLSLPMNPSSYSNGANVFWYENSQALETDESYFLKWFSSKQANTLVQTYTPNSPDWFIPVGSQIGQRAAFNFNNTYLTGTGISNTGDFLALFSVLSLSDNNHQCIINFSDSKKYGLFASGASLYFINGTESSQISTSPLSLNSYYSVGFVRNSTHFTGLIDGVVSNTGLISVSDLPSIKPSLGASYSQDDFFNGQIAELLVYNKNSQPYLTNTGELNFLFNSKFGIVV